MDERSYEQAAALAEAERAAALERRQRYVGVSQTHCLECGDAIPEKRRELIPGVERCTDCQRMREARHV